MDTGRLKRLGLWIKLMAVIGGIALVSMWAMVWGLACLVERDHKLLNQVGSLSVDLSDAVGNLVLDGE